MFCHPGTESVMNTQRKVQERGGGRGELVELQTFSPHLLTSGRQPQRLEPESAARRTLIIHILFPRSGQEEELFMVQNNR